MKGNKMLRLETPYTHALSTLDKCQHVLRLEDCRTETSLPKHSHCFRPCTFPLKLKHTPRYTFARRASS